MNKLFERLGGRKSTFAFLGLVVSFLIALIWSYIIKDWEYLKFFTPFAVGGILAYGGLNITHKKLNGGNNGK